MNEDIALKIIHQKFDPECLTFDGAMYKGMKQFGAGFFAIEIIAIADDWCEKGKISETECEEIINHVEFLENKYVQNSNEKFKNNEKYKKFIRECSKSSIVNSLSDSYNLIENFKKNYEMELELHELHELEEMQSDLKSMMNQIRRILNDTRN